MEKRTCHSRSCIICSCLLLIDCVDAYQLLKDFPLTLILLGSAEVHSVLILVFWNNLGLMFASLSLHICLLFYGRRNKKFGQVDSRLHTEFVESLSPQRDSIILHPHYVAHSVISGLTWLFLRRGIGRIMSHSTFHLKSSFIYAIRQCCTRFLLILIMQDRFFVVVFLVRFLDFWELVGNMRYATFIYLFFFPGLVVRCCFLLTLNKRAAYYTAWLVAAHDDQQRTITKS